jgi:hypothetical protein
MYDWNKAYKTDSNGFILLARFRRALACMHVTKVQQKVRGRVAAAVH